MGVVISYFNEVPIDDSDDIVEFSNIYHVASDGETDKLVQLP